jgi:beta-N-acetylhexosaminidase
MRGTIRGDVMATTARRAVCWLGLVLLVASACAEGPSVPAATAIAGSGSASAALASPTGTVTAGGGSPSPSTVEGAASCVSRTLASMTRAQRIGQLFMIRVPVDELTAADRTAIADQHFGNAWYSRSTSGVAAMRTLSDAIQATATSTATNRVPFLIGANQEGGLIQGLSGPGFSPIPSAVAQGRLEPSQLETLAATWAGQLRRAGVNVNFAPVADVVPPGTADQNAPIGQLDREYGHHPKPVARHVAAFIEGMQAGGVGPTAKHFPGLGRVEGNTDHTADVTDSVTTADDSYLRPFRRAIVEGVPFVMVSLATYERIDPASIAAFSRIVIHDLLRRDLGFTGVVMSDSLTAEAVKAISPRERALRFLAAGGDLIVLARLQPAISMASGLADAAASDPQVASRIDDASRRILRAKADAGLLACAS